MVKVIRKRKVGKVIKTGRNRNSLKGKRQTKRVEIVGSFSYFMLEIRVNKF